MAKWTHKGLNQRNWSSSIPWHDTAKKFRRNFFAMVCSLQCLLWAPKVCNSQLFPSTLRPLSPLYSVVMIPMGLQKSPQEKYWLSLQDFLGCATIWLLSFSIGQLKWKKHNESYLQKPRTREVAGQGCRHWCPITFLKIPFQLAINYHILYFFFMVFSHMEKDSLEL